MIVNTKVEEKVSISPIAAFCFLLFVICVLLFFQYQPLLFAFSVFSILTNGFFWKKVSYIADAGIPIHLSTFDAYHLELTGKLKCIPCSSSGQDRFAIQIECEEIKFAQNSECWR